MYIIKGGIAALVSHQPAGCISSFAMMICEATALMICKATALMICNGVAVDFFRILWYNPCKGSETMTKNYLLIYSEQLSTSIELMCREIKAQANTIFQIRKSSSSVYANICEAQYGQSKADMLSKFEIALKECSETEGWLQLLFNTGTIREDVYKNYRNLCGRIRRMLIASCKTIKEKMK